jgi:hypothetical protein
MKPRNPGAVPLLAALLLAGATAGCVRGCPSSRPPIHLNPNMDDQEKYRAQSESRFFYDGSSMRVPIPGTVARGELRTDSRVFQGREADGTFVRVNPLEVNEALLARGAERFAIYCAPCHDASGGGQGILKQRAGVTTTSLHDPRLLAIEDGHLFNVITNGVGLMPGYRWPIDAEDRWAIIAHVRRLQEK